MSDSHDALEDASREDLLALIEEQRERVGLYAETLLGIGFDPIDLLEAAG
jgi:hypothetical protein